MLLKGNLYPPEELPEFDLDEHTLAWLGELKYFAEEEQMWGGLMNDDLLSHKDM